MTTKFSYNGFWLSDVYYFYKDGLFLLRKSRQEAYQAYSLSVYFKQVVYHLKVRVLNSGYTIGMPKEDELVIFIT